MVKRVNITGTMVKGKLGWEKRTEELATPDNFLVIITPLANLWRGLDKCEKERLNKKLLILEEAVKYLAAGMVKGTVKYPTDNYSMEQWMAHLIGEGADQFNYQILLFDKWSKIRKEKDNGKVS